MHRNNITSVVLSALFCSAITAKVVACPQHEQAKNMSALRLAQVVETKAARSREGFNQPLVLSGLNKIKLVISDDKFSADNGFNKGQIKNLIIDEMVPTHATIVSDSDSCSGNGCKPVDIPLLYLKIKSNSEQNSFTINLSLVEKVRVNRNKQELMVAVWSEDSSGKFASSAAESLSEINSQLKELIKDFRRDFSLANSADIGHSHKHPMKKENSGMPQE